MSLSYSRFSLIAITYYQKCELICKTVTPSSGRPVGESPSFPQGLAQRGRIPDLSAGGQPPPQTRLNTGRGRKGDSNIGPKAAIGPSHKPWLQKREGRTANRCNKRQVEEFWSSMWTYVNLCPDTLRNPERPRTEHRLPAHLQ